jgi:deoxyribodipyrimidine photo-lyase
MLGRRFDGGRRVLFVTTAVVLFSRDLRVHDQPALAAACRRASRVVPLHVLDDADVDRDASPNRVAHLLEALTDLREALRERGGDLLVRCGSTVEQVRAICSEVGADEVHLSGDVTEAAHVRQEALADALGEIRVDLHLHDGVTVVAPGTLTPADGDHYRVFSPYWRRWAAVTHRDPEPAPDRVPTPEGLDPGPIPDLAELVATLLVDGLVAPKRGRGGETVARARLDDWLAHGADDYLDTRDVLAIDGTSRLSAHLQAGTLSATEVVHRLDRSRPGHEAFLRQLCWRDFNHQLLAARPDLEAVDYRPRGDQWVDDPGAVAAWKAGTTGYPVVDAGMRQLRREGYMHNRVRMIVASFLTKHLRVDWRVGARHFMDHLEDGDVANNVCQWQWAAGTGTDSRPNRMLNPVAQGRRHDPQGVYVRRYVAELAEVPGRWVHAPWEHPDGLAAAPDYPPPVVDHDEARARFLFERGR